METSSEVAVAVDFQRGGGSGSGVELNTLYLIILGETGIYIQSAI